MFEQPSLRVTILSIHTYLTSFQRWKISGASTTTSAWQATCLQAPTTAFSRSFVRLICKRCITKKSIWVSEWKTIHDILENSSYYHNTSAKHSIETIDSLSGGHIPRLGGREEWSRRKMDHQFWQVKPGTTFMIVWSRIVTISNCTPLQTAAGRRSGHSLAWDPHILDRGAGRGWRLS